MAAKGGGCIDRHPKTRERQPSLTEMAIATYAGTLTGMCNRRFLWNETHVWGTEWRVLQKTAEKQPKKSWRMIEPWPGEGGFGTWLNRMRCLSNHGRHLQFSGGRPWTLGWWLSGEEVLCWEPCVSNQQHSLLWNKCLWALCEHLIKLNKHFIECTVKLYFEIYERSHFNSFVLFLTLGLQLSVFIRRELWKGPLTAGFMACFSCLLTVVN